MDTHPEPQFGLWTGLELQVTADGHQVQGHVNDLWRVTSYLGQGNAWNDIISCMTFEKWNITICDEKIPW